MISTELATRILLTVFIVGAYSINYCRASDDADENYSLKPNQNIGDEEQTTSSVESSLSSRSFQSSKEAENNDNAGTRLMPDSAEAGILLPIEDDLPHPGGDGSFGRRFNGGYPSNQNEDQRRFPESVSFDAKPIPLRISNAKALNWDTGKLSGEDEKPTYYIRNSCFGPRCTKSNNNQQVEDWKTVYYTNKESKAKKFDDGIMMSPARRLQDNVMESVSSNFHSQLAIPFVVVDDSVNSLRRPQTFSRRSGVDRFNRMTSTTNSPPGWVKLKPISPDAYDPFHYSTNSSRDSERRQSTFSKRDSSNANGNTVNFSKRVGVELNPDSFADRWGWSTDGNDNNNRGGGGGGGGSRLPAWLEEQLKYGTRNSDNKNWVKLDPIPVAGVSISKWVPKGTPSQDLPTTNWQTNRDRPNGGNPWWDRIDQNRILTGNNGNRHAFLRPGAEDNHHHQSSYNPPPSNNNMGWGDSNKGNGNGNSLSSLDRYPTNAWNDVVYPDGPLSATVSWQQTKGTGNYASSFSSSGGGGNSGWPSSISENTRKPVVATGSWSAPQNNRLPSFLNRFSDRRPSSYPTKQINEEDPRWVLISNSRRVAHPTGNENDRTKALSYLNKLHPDLDRSSDFPFYEPSSSSSAHRHGKGYWPFQQGSATVPVSPGQDEAFHRINATLSTLTPVLIHRGSGGTTVRPPIVGTIRPNKSGVIFSSTGSPIFSNYIGDGRGTSSDADLLSSTTTPVRTLPGRLRQGLKNINPIYAAVGAGMIPATLAAVMPMVLGRKRRDVRRINHLPIFIRRNNKHISNHATSTTISINPIKFRNHIARLIRSSNR